jgi:spermidine synthase
MTDSKKARIMTTLEPRFYEQLREKLAEDGFSSFQKFSVMFLTAYVNNNREIRILIDRYTEENKIEPAGKKAVLTEFESSKLLMQIEENSPLK